MNLNLYLKGKAVREIELQIRIEKDTPSYICLEEGVEGSFESMEVERVEDSFDSIEEKRIEDSFDSIDDDAESGLQDDKIMEETPGDICLKERVEDSFERMEVES